MDNMVTGKGATAGNFTGVLSRIPDIRCPEEPLGAFSTIWLYTSLVDEKAVDMSNHALPRHLDGRGIQAGLLWQPMNLSPAHRGSYVGDCSVAGRHNRVDLSLPCSVGISDSETEQVVSANGMFTR